MAGPTIITSPTCMITHANGTTTGYFASVNTDTAAGTAIAAALIAAVSGEVIAVYRNATITSSLAANGINWWFAPNITLTMSQDAAGFMFDDGGVAMTYTVGGEGNFVRSLSATSAANAGYTFGILNVSNSSSNVIFNAQSMSMTAANGGSTSLGAMIASQAGKASIRCATSSIASNNAITSMIGCWWSGGEVDYSGTDILDNSNSSGVGGVILILADVESGSTTVHGRFNFQNIQGSTTNAAAMAVENESSNSMAACWVTASTIQGTIFPGGGKTYITTQKLIGNVDTSGGGLTNPTEFHMFAEKVGGDLTLSTNVSGAYISISANFTKSWITVNRFDVGANATNLIIQTGGTSDVTFLSGMDFTGASNQDCFVVTKGKLNLVGGVITAVGTGKDLNQSSTGAINIYGTKYNSANVTGTATPQTALTLAYRAVGSGTVYSITATPAAIAMGTTSPAITLAVAGTYRIRGFVNLKNNNTTYAASRTVTLVIHRTNNTGADLSNASYAVLTGTLTGITSTLALVYLEADYYTATAGDAITIYGSIDVVPSVGSLDVVGTWIEAEKVG